MSDHPLDAAAHEHCLNLLSEKEHEPFMSAVLVGEKGTWRNVDDVCRRTGVAPPAAVDLSIAVTWLDEPTNAVGYAVITFYCPRSLWSTTALYNRARLASSAIDAALRALPDDVVLDAVGVDEIAGVARGVLTSGPDAIVHGVRHRRVRGTCGWYVHVGEAETDADFYQPMHVAHLVDARADLTALLSLPPGWHFLWHAAGGYIDVWYVEADDVE